MSTTYFVINYLDDNDVLLHGEITTNPVLSLSILTSEVWVGLLTGSTLDRFTALADTESALARIVEDRKPLFNQWADEDARERWMVDYLIERDRRDLLVPLISRG